MPCRLDGATAEPDDAALSADPSGDRDTGFALVATHVDAAFYHARSPDVRAAGMDPARHYWSTGWREGRDPNAWFQTDYYLRANPDVKRSGLNPLWHFLVQGRREGRLPRPDGDAWREVLEHLVTPSRRPVLRAVADGVPVLAAEALRDLILAATATARGLVVSVSHDRYLEVPGGTQLLIADEQRKFNGDGAAYLHLSPIVPRLGLAPAAAETQWLNVILDGSVRGIASTVAAAVAVADLPAAPPRLLVVHNLHGHRPECVADLAAALRPSHAVFWVHDFGAVCGNPRLLRNDIAFCHAPPPDSMACRVCIHGDDRASHLDRVRALFEAVRFHVVAPSPGALELWLRAANLPCASARVHPHTSYGPPEPARPAAEGKLRVAFVGHAEYHKGWGVFRDLVAAVCDRDDLQLFHFASPAELRGLDGVTLVSAETSAARPFGMTEALAAQDIDLVLALSPWPETFGYVAHEALAAGADLLTLAASGNVAALVRQTGRGVVLDDARELVGFFLQGAAAAHVRRQRAAGRIAPPLRHRGSTATLCLSDTAVEPLTPEPDLHLLVDGERLDGRLGPGGWHFVLPEQDRAGPALSIRLRSRHLQPLWKSRSGADPRRLGVAVSALLLDGERIAPGDCRCGAGWHDPEPGWQWTDGDAELIAGGARALDVSLVPLGRYWRAPLFAT